MFPTEAEFTKGGRRCNAPRWIFWMSREFVKLDRLGVLYGFDWQNMMVSRT